MEPATLGKKKNVTKKTKSGTAMDTKNRLQRSKSSTSTSKATKTTEPGSLTKTAPVADEYEYDSSDEEVTQFIHTIYCCVFISRVLCLVKIYLLKSVLLPECI